MKTTILLTLALYISNQAFSFEDGKNNQFMEPLKFDIVEKGINIENQFKEIDKLLKKVTESQKSLLKKHGIRETEVIGRLTAKKMYLKLLEWKKMGLLTGCIGNINFTEDKSQSITIEALLEKGSKAFKIQGPFKIKDISNIDMDQKPVPNYKHLSYIGDFYKILRLRLDSYNMIHLNTVNGRVYTITIKNYFKNKELVDNRVECDPKR